MVLQLFAILGGLIVQVFYHGILQLWRNTPKEIIKPWITVSYNNLADGINRLAYFFHSLWR